MLQRINVEEHAHGCIALVMKQCRARCRHATARQSEVDAKLKLHYYLAYRLGLDTRHGGFVGSEHPFAKLLAQS